MSVARSSHFGTCILKQSVSRTGTTDTHKNQPVMYFNPGAERRQHVFPLRFSKSCLQRRLDEKVRSDDTRTTATESLLLWRCELPRSTRVVLFNPSAGNKHLQAYQVTREHADLLHGPQNVGFNRNVSKVFSDCLCHKSKRPTHHSHAITVYDWCIANFEPPELIRHGRQASFAGASIACV